MLRTVLTPLFAQSCVNQIPSSPHNAINSLKGIKGSDELADHHLLRNGLEFSHFLRQGIQAKSGLIENR